MLFRNTTFCMASMLCLTAFIISTQSIGQTAYQNGYYITLDHDTIYGLIRNKGEMGNSSSCTYKRDKSSDPIRFSAEDINGYAILNEKYYVAKIIKTDNWESRVFVELLISGHSNLYFYRDQNNYFYIIENKAGRLYELYKKSETVAQKGSGEVTRDTYRHIRMLKTAFSDCMEIQPKIEKTQLNRRSMVRITNDYNNCISNEKSVIYSKPDKKNMIQIAPVLGFTSSLLSFNREFYSEFNYDRSLNFTFGLQVDAIFYSINDRFSLQLDLLYNKNNFTGSFSDYYKIYINNNSLKPSLLAKYTIPTGNIRPSFGLGLCLNYLLGPDITAIVDNVPGEPPSERKLENIYMSTTLFGFVAQVGLNYKIFQDRVMFTNFRYDNTAGYANGSSGKVTTNISSFNLSIGFNLIKVR